MQREAMGQATLGGGHERGARGAATASAATGPGDNASVALHAPCRGRGGGYVSCAGPLSARAPGFGSKLCGMWRFSVRRRSSGGAWTELSAAPTVRCAIGGKRAVRRDGGPRASARALLAPGVALSRRDGGWRVPAPRGGRLQVERAGKSLRVPARFCGRSDLPRGPAAGSCWVQS